MLGNLQSMIGKKGVIVPGEASPPSEWDNFHRQMGRPDTKDQYQMKVPEDLAQYYDENLVAEARNLFFEEGYDQKKVDKLWEFEEKRIRAGLEAVAQKFWITISPMLNYCPTYLLNIRTTRLSQKRNKRSA